MGVPGAPGRWEGVRGTYGSKSGQGEPGGAGCPEAPPAPLKRRGSPWPWAAWTACERPRGDEARRPASSVPPSSLFPFPAMQTAATRTEPVLRHSRSEVCTVMSRAPTPTPTPHAAPRSPRHVGRFGGLVRGSPEAARRQQNRPRREAQPGLSVSRVVSEAARKALDVTLRQLRAAPRGSFLGRGPRAAGGGTVVNTPGISLPRFPGGRAGCSPFRLAALTALSSARLAGHH